MLISIVVPVYNERDSIRTMVQLLRTVVLAGHEKEIIIVDDGSTDGTGEVLAGADFADCRVFRQTHNMGKGAAVRLGFRKARGDVVVIQDADLEYDPRHIPELIEPILSGKADAVYGSRFVTPYPRRAIYFSHYLANTFLTFLSNVCTGFNLSDMETGAKAFSRNAIDRIQPHLRALRFDIEPELTAQLAHHRLRVYEVGVSYSGRTYQEGKKITWSDGIAAIWYILKYNFFSGS